MVHTAAIRTREGTGKKRKKKERKEEKKKGGMGIVGREIAASRLLKQLVKSRMAGLRMSKGKAANSTSCSNKNGNVENGEKQREREGSVSKKEEPIYRIGQDRCLSDVPFVQHAQGVRTK